jgi:hypothetical protein
MKKRMHLLIVLFFIYIMYGFSRYLFNQKTSFLFAYGIIGMWLFTMLFIFFSEDEFPEDTGKPIYTHTLSIRDYLYRYLESESIFGKNNLLISFFGFALFLLFVIYTGKDAILFFIGHLFDSYLGVLALAIILLILWIVLFIVHFLRVILSKKRSMSITLTTKGILFTWHDNKTIWDIFFLEKLFIPWQEISGYSIHPKEHVIEFSYRSFNIYLLKKVVVGKKGVEILKKHMKNL